MTVQDVGGVVSLSVTPARHVEGCYNFDIGPRSVVIDAVVRHLTHEENEYDCVMGSREVDWKAWVKCPSIHTLRRTS
jgi:1,6-anhydro-N-acetylmuramate kinase